MQAAVSALGDPNQLRALLGRAIGARRIRRAVVGLATDEFTASAAAGTEVAAGPSEPAEERIRVGCLVKLFTATLVLDAVAAGLIALDAPVLEYLPRVNGASATLQAVRIRHLLEHTHGLDDSLLGIDCLDCSNRIDVELICRYVSSTPPLSAPGERYSYSHVSSLLAAAVLERRFDTSYADAVRVRLLGPLGIDVDAGAFRISPAFEAEHSLSVSELLRLVRHCVRGRFGEHSRAITSLPGWNPIERGISLGWKAYGDDWYGHASDLREYLTIVKAHPDSGTTLLVSAADFAPSAIMSAVFGQALPRSHQLRFPRMLGAQERRGLDFAAYRGEFTNAALTVSFAQADQDALMITVDRGDGSRRELACRALPARDHLFVCDSAAGDFAVFQFIEPQPTGFRFLWNGKAILRGAANRDIAKEGAQTP